ncbi:magnesium transporter [Alicycliphilus sp. B1]|nr:magnesium transporter [Alicycliphilus sp. B1]
MVQAGIGMLHARDLAPRDRVRGTKLPSWPCSALRAAFTTSALVEPTSITSICGVTRCLMALSVAGGGHGTASSTMSAPAAASRAEGASTSITPSWRARSVVEGDLL